MGNCCEENKNNDNTKTKNLFNERPNTNLDSINDFDRLEIMKNSNSDVQAYKETNVNLHFITPDRKINYDIGCEYSDKFSSVEDKLYEKYPELRNKKGLMFIANGNIIKRTKTIEENMLKNRNTIITLYNN